MSQNSGTLQINHKNNVAEIMFYHPASNSMPSYLLEQLAQEIEKLNKNEDCQILVVKSQGEKTFCAGASFDELLAIETLEQGTYFFSGFAKVINALRKSNKFVIGSIQGKAVGGGVGIISACDYSIATQNASVKLSELSIGIGPFVIEPAVTRKIGLQALSQMTLEAEQWKTAQWALENKLYNKLVDSIENLEIETQKFAQKLASYNPQAIKEMKKVLWQNTQHWETLLFERAQISGNLVLSSFTKKALSQFKNK